ncbi:MAG: HEPN domain-containing protein [Arenicella sp.]|jgi:HEPN domain-containing protein
MSTVRKQKTFSGEEADKILGFINDGYSDYLAARVLLNSNLLSQGAVLAASSLEKYLKVILGLHGNRSHGHLKKAHWNALKDHSPGMYRKIDEEFMRLCQKCYKLRYQEDLELGFNLVIPQWDFLAELDKTVSLIESSIDFFSDGEKHIRGYLNAKEKNDPRLLNYNHVLLNFPIQRLHEEQPQRVYEMRNCVLKKGILEIKYVSGGETLRKGFMREGAKTKDGKTYQCAFSYEPRND